MNLFFYLLILFDFSVDMCVFQKKKQRQVLGIKTTNFNLVITRFFPLSFFYS
jgi:hypothetical protein